MEKKIKLFNKDFVYRLKTSHRAKRMRLAIYCDSSFVVTRPAGLSEDAVENFILQKSKWIISKLDYFKQFQIIATSRAGRYADNKNKALLFVKNKVNEMNKLYNFKYKEIFIKRQKTRWGSCSKKRNLNFNYKIIFLPEDLAEYIVAHELCHLQEFNHSKKFWNLVAKAIPDCGDRRKRLNKIFIR